MPANATRRAGCSNECPARRVGRQSGALPVELRGIDGSRGGTRTRSLRIGKISAVTPCGHASPAVLIPQRLKQGAEAAYSRAVRGSEAFGAICGFS
jgi:hypothetical protein